MLHVVHSHLRFRLATDVDSIMTTVVNEMMQNPRELSGLLDSNSSVPFNFQGMMPMNRHFNGNSALMAFNGFQEPLTSASSGMGRKS